MVYANIPVGTQFKDGTWRHLDRDLDADLQSVFGVGVQRLVRVYIRGDLDVDDLLFYDETLSYLHADHLGSSSLATDAAGGVISEMRYYPYGGTRTGALETDRRYTGQRWESSVGLYDYNARFYDPYLNRFISPDTIVPDFSNPQSLNRYAYVYNNPLKYTDPTGHWVDTAIDLISIGFTINEIRRDGLNWKNGVSLAADVASLALPVVAGGGMMVRAATKADDVVDAVRATDRAGDAIRAADNLDDVGDLLRTADDLDEADIVYRVVSPDEHPTSLLDGLNAKDPARRVHPQRHVTHGNHEMDNWISTTRDPDWARMWQGEEPIYVIDLDRVSSPIVDTTVPGTMDGWFWHAKTLATRASEVLVDTYIPPEAIIGLIPR